MKYLVIYKRNYVMINKVRIPRDNYYIKQRVRDDNTLNNLMKHENVVVVIDLKENKEILNKLK